MLISVQDKMTVVEYSNLFPRAPRLYRFVSTTSQTVKVDRDRLQDKVSADRVSLAPDRVLPPDHIFEDENKLKIDHPHRNATEIHDKPGKDTYVVSPPQEYTVNHIVRHLGNVHLHKYVVRC